MKNCVKHFIINKLMHTLAPTAVRVKRTYKFSQITFGKMLDCLEIVLSFISLGFKFSDISVD